MSNENCETIETLTETKKKKTCFFITPIGDEGTDIRIATDGLILSILEPLCKEFGISLNVSHKMDTLGNIGNQIVMSIIENDLAIVNLTGLNPNVMYELAIRHAVGKPVICLAENGTKLPFDINGERTIFYDDNIIGGYILKSRLKKTIQGVIDSIDKDEDNNDYSDNPILRANKMIKSKNNLLSFYNGNDDNSNESKNENKNDVLGFILDRLVSIEDRLPSFSTRSDSDNLTHINKLLVKLSNKLNNLNELRGNIKRTFSQLMPSEHVILDISRIDDYTIKIKVTFIGLNKNEIEQLNSILFDVIISYDHKCTIQKIK